MIQTLKSDTVNISNGFRLKISHDPPAQPCGGEGGCLLCNPKDLLPENVSYTYIIIKITPKMTFLEETLKQKVS
jgi:hypothetical protein